jgi:hypothetical protein
MQLEPPLAHLLGIPLEELLPVALGFGAVLAYLRLVLGSARRSGSRPPGPHRL